MSDDFEPGEEVQVYFKVGNDGSLIQTNEENWDTFRKGVIVRNFSKSKNKDFDYYVMLEVSKEDAGRIASCWSIAQFDVDNYDFPTGSADKYCMLVKASSMKKKNPEPHYNVGDEVNIFLRTENNQDLIISDKVNATTFARGKIVFLDPESKKYAVSIFDSPKQITPKKNDITYKNFYLKNAKWPDWARGRPCFVMTSENFERASSKLQKTTLPKSDKIKIRDRVYIYIREHVDKNEFGDKGNWDRREKGTIIAESNGAYVIVFDDESLNVVADNIIVDKDAVGKYRISENHYNEFYQRKAYRVELDNISEVGSDPAKALQEKEVKKSQSEPKYKVGNRVKISKDLPDVIWNQGSSPNIETWADITFEVIGISTPIEKSSTEGLLDRSYKYILGSRLVDEYTGQYVYYTFSNLNEDAIKGLEVPPVENSKASQPKATKYKVGDWVYLTGISYPYRVTAVYKDCADTSNDYVLETRFGSNLATFIQKYKNEFHSVRPGPYEKMGVRLVTESMILGFASPPDSQNEKDKGQDTMSENKFLSTVKDDGIEASYRVAAHQLTKTTKATLVKIFKESGMKKSQLKALTELLDSEAGFAAMSFLMGFAAMYVPKLKDDPKVKRLAKEFRIEGMTVGGNLLMGEFTQTLLPMVMSQLSTLSEVPAPMRVEAPQTASEKAEEAAEEEEIASQTEVKRN